MKEHMMEAMKRKRALLHEEHDGEHAQGQSAMTGNEELAPARGAHKSDAMLGHPDGKNTEQDARSSTEYENQTELGKQGGFDHEVHSSPVNSKNMFHDPKKDTHDDADPNMHRNMAGDGGGLNAKYDKMGVDEHKDVRHQSSSMAKHNMDKGEALKHQELSKVQGKTAIGHHAAMQPGIDSDSDHEIEAENDGDEAPKSHFGMKGARAKLDGFLSKMKR